MVPDPHTQDSNDWLQTYARGINQAARDTEQQHLWKTNTHTHTTVVRHVKKRTKEKAEEWTQKKGRERS